MMDEKRFKAPVAAHPMRFRFSVRSGRRLAAVLFAAMLCLAACGTQPAGVNSSSSPSAAEAGAPTESSGVSESAAATESTSPSAETSASPSDSPTASAEATDTAVQPSEATTEAAVAMPGDRTPSLVNGQAVKVKALYLTGPKCGVALDHYIDVANKTEINALVIDIKETAVNYEPNVPLCQELKLYTKYYDADEVIKKCHENGIYVIGRIVVFRDNALAQKKPAYAIHKPDGSFWLENKSKTGAWTSPAVPEVLDYNIEIAKDAVTRGFDEIQFDYVRFPSVSKCNQSAYPADMPDKIDVIVGFLKSAARSSSVRCRAADPAQDQETLRRAGRLQGRYPAIPAGLYRGLHQEPGLLPDIWGKATPGTNSSRI